MSIPNFMTRPLALDDAEKVVELLNAVSSDMSINRSYHANFFRAEWGEPDFDITQSTYGVFSNDEELVAYALIWDTHDNPVHPIIEWAVHPDYLDHDLGAQLLQWAEKTCQRIIALCPPDARLSLHTTVLKGYAPVENTLAQEGYIAIRAKYDMRIDMESRPEPAAIADIFIVRTYKDEKDLPDFVRAFQDSFSDHFGYVERDFDKVVEEFRHWFSTDVIDPALVFFAIDKASGEIVGYVLGLNEFHDPSMGYIDLMGVRRNYRRRGLARNLLQHAFREYWDQGKKSVTLEVDGESLTNAVTFYEKSGMTIEYEYLRYEKLMREGRELAKVSVE